MTHIPHEAQLPAALAPTVLWWRKSSRSIPSGECVEVAVTGDLVLVRDSRTSAGPILCFTSTAWTRFLHALTHGHLGPAGYASTSVSSRSRALAP